MKKLLTIIAMLSISAAVSAQTVKTQSCTYKVGEKTYKSDNMVLIQFDLLEQQIRACEEGARVIVKNTNSVHLNFKYKSPSKSGKFEIPESCRKLDEIVSAWNNTIDRLLGEDRNPIIAALTMSAIRQTVENNPFKSADKNVNSWYMFRNEYPTILEFKITDNYESGLLYSERGSALAEKEVVTDMDLINASRRTELMANINPLKTFDAVIDGKVCTAYKNDNANVISGVVSVNSTPQDKPKEEKNKDEKDESEVNNVNPNQANLDQNEQTTVSADGTYKGDVEGKSLEVVVTGNAVSSITFNGEKVENTPTVNLTANFTDDEGGSTDIVATVNNGVVTVTANGVSVVVAK